MSRIFTNLTIIYAFYLLSQNGILSPSQTSDDFNSFVINLEKLVVIMSSSNPHFILMIGDFNWSSNDPTTAEGAQLDYFTSL